MRKSGGLARITSKNLTLSGTVVVKPGFDTMDFYLVSGGSGGAQG